jgi:exosortase
MRLQLRYVEIGIWGVLVASLVYLFGVEGNTEEVSVNGHSAAKWMIGRWIWFKTDMSHGWLIPLVSLYMVWSRRAELRASLSNVSWVGFGVVVSSLALYLAGVRVQQTVIVLVSLIGLLWGIPYYLYGRKVAGILFWPCSYLIFCIPMTFLDYLTFPLRMVSSTVSVGLLNGLGIPVTQLGTAIHVNVGQGLALDVAHPCSGLRYLLAMVALTTAYAYFTQKSWLKRGILSLSSIPLAMVGNIARITLIAVVGVLFGEEIAVGFYHDYSGYVVFAVATLLMLGLGKILDRPGFALRMKGKEELADE